MRTHYPDLQPDVILHLGALAQFPPPAAGAAAASANK